MKVNLLENSFVELKTFIYSNTFVLAIYEVGDSNRMNKTSRKEVY